MCREDKMVTTWPSSPTLTWMSFHLSQTCSPGTLNKAQLALLPLSPSVAYGDRKSHSNKQSYFTGRPACRAVVPWGTARHLVAIDHRLWFISKNKSLPAPCVYKHWQPEMFSKAFINHFESGWGEISSPGGVPWVKLSTRFIKTWDVPINGPHWHEAADWIFFFFLFFFHLPAIIRFVRNPDDAVWQLCRSLERRPLTCHAWLHLSLWLEAEALVFWGEQA